MRAAPGAVCGASRVAGMSAVAAVKKTRYQVNCGRSARVVYLQDGSTAPAASPHFALVRAGTTKNPPAYQ